MRGRSRAGKAERPAVAGLAAGIQGFEPQLTEPESVVLPVTPYPNGFQRNRGTTLPEPLAHREPLRPSCAMLLRAVRTQNLLGTGSIETNRGGFGCARLAGRG